jgi:hypothetical protein
MDSEATLKAKSRPRADARGAGIPLVDLFLINLPMTLFIVLATAAALVASRCRFPASIAPLLVSWWALCGAFMLGKDYLERKRGLYLRLRSIMPPSPEAALSRSLGRTLCGMAVLAAALRYSKRIRTRSGFHDLETERGSI